MPKLAIDALVIANRLLQDVAATRWDESVLLPYLSAAQRLVVTVDPMSNAARAPLQLVAGVDQTFPADCQVPLAVQFDTGTGRPVTQVDEVLLSLADPLWRSQSASTVDHFMRDPAENRAFRVYPPQSATPARVQVLYGKRPAELLEGGDPIEVDEKYFDALISYTVFRALSEDGSDPANTARAGSFLQEFNAKTGAQISHDLAKEA